MPNRRQTWPYAGASNSPPALSLSPDCLLSSDRSLAAVGRLGTVPNVGPRGTRPGGFNGSDFGRADLRYRYDPIGVTWSRPTRGYIRDRTR